MTRKGHALDKDLLLPPGAAILPRPQGRPPNEPPLAPPPPTRACAACRAHPTINPHPTIARAEQDASEKVSVYHTTPNGEVDRAKRGRGTLEQRGRTLCGVPSVGRGYICLSVCQVYRLPRSKPPSRCVPALYHIRPSSVVRCLRCLSPLSALCTLWCVRGVRLFIYPLARMI